MEALAILAFILASLTGYLICRTIFGGADEDLLYFCPALGLLACAIVAYLSACIHLTWLIPGVAIGSFAGALVKAGRLPPIHTCGKNQGFFWFTILIIACVYLMQTTLFHLFRHIFPGPNEVWTFHLTGTPPPDQMFAWHQAMFIDQHRNYPRDPFYGEMDFYDRPHLGGYLTLFFFRLFHLPLVEKQFTYPAGALHFYHSLW